MRELAQFPIPTIPMRTLRGGGLGACMLSLLMPGSGQGKFVFRERMMIAFVPVVCAGEDRYQARTAQKRKIVNL
jgi:hypothetical protein